MQPLKRCGEFPPFGYDLTGDIFTVTFVSNHIHNAKGFKLSWRVYIPDTTTRTTTTTTQPTTTTKKTTTEPTTTITMKKTISRTTITLNLISKKSTNRESQTLTSALLTSIPTKKGHMQAGQLQRTHRRL